MIQLSLSLPSLSSVISIAYTAHIDGHNLWPIGRIIKRSSYIIHFDDGQNVNGKKTTIYTTYDGKYKIGNNSHMRPIKFGAQTHTHTHFQITRFHLMLHTATATHSVGISRLCVCVCVEPMTLNVISVVLFVSSRYYQNLHHATNAVQYGKNNTTKIVVSYQQISWLHRNEGFSRLLCFTCTTYVIFAICITVSCFAFGCFELSRTHSKSTQFVIVFIVRWWVASVWWFQRRN